jgi:hypothetical protein
MRFVLGSILESFEAILDRQAISPSERGCYKKWLTYFLELCARYAVPEARSDQVRWFIDKLRGKKQVLPQQDQAAHAVSLYLLKYSARAKFRLRIAMPVLGPSRGQRPKHRPLRDLGRFGRGLLPCPRPLRSPIESGAGKHHLVHFAHTAPVLASLGRWLCRYLSIAGMGGGHSRARG